MNDSITPSSVYLLLPKVSGWTEFSISGNLFWDLYKTLGEPGESNTIKLLLNLFTSPFSKIRSMGMNMYEHV